MPDARTAYEALIAHARETYLYRAAGGLLSWDQETQMPPGGVAFRSQQMAALAKLTHARTTDPQAGEWLADAEAGGFASDSDEGANLRELRRTYDRATKLPSELVQERARLSSVAHHAWQEARKANDYEAFRPYLEQQVALARRTAECYGWAPDGEPWDALAEGYEPGMTARSVEAVFGPLRERLTALIARFTGSGRTPTRRFNEIEAPIEAQKAFVREVAQRIGYDLRRGRIDTSAHPFCSGSHPGDVRITNRFKDVEVGDALAATMHESGHAMYEQGLPEEHTATPLGQAVSLGIHESQSRMWENFVGRSLAFWRWCVGELPAYFGSLFDGLSAEDCFVAMNRVEPSLIRVESDEATYNLHIMVRFETERALLNGDLDATELPAWWNQKYKEYLGVEVPDDANGCMQDVHWSGGAFGYFPTYTLGNLYAAQLFEKAVADTGGFDDAFASGSFGDLLAWLRENVHRHGARYLPAELCERATGQPLSADPLLRHLEGKLGPIYAT